MSGAEILIMGIGITIWIGIAMCSTIARAIQENARARFKNYYHMKYTPGTKVPSLEQSYKNLVKILIAHANQAHYQNPIDGSYFGTSESKIVPFAACVIVMTDEPNYWFVACKLRILFPKTTR